MLDEIETLNANNVNDASGRQRRPSLHLPRHVHADRDCVVGHRLCQGPVPRRLHQGHRDEVLDPEGPDQILITDPKFVHSQLGRMRPEFLVLRSLPNENMRFV